ncbi:hypothetical protein ACSV5M_14555 [Cellvibrio sp. ARAG 10.3]|uniref:hypothetical protein n=1 Tax=Cellvibrio sp. ARAG 10.3 TaxID=3451358 RepID=UPI003F469DFA
MFNGKIVIILAILLVSACSMQQEQWEKYYKKDELFVKNTDAYYFEEFSLDEAATIFFQAKKKEVSSDEAATTMLTAIEVDGVPTNPRPSIFRKEYREQLERATPHCDTFEDKTRKIACLYFKYLVESEKEVVRDPKFNNRGIHSIRGQQAVVVNSGNHSFKVLLFSSGRFGRGDLGIYSVPDLNLSPGYYFVYFDMDDGVVVNKRNVRIWIEESETGRVVWEVRDKV